MITFSPPPYREKDLTGQPWQKWFSLLYTLFAKVVIEFNRSSVVRSTAISTALLDSDRTIIVTVTGMTVTLPAASLLRIGRDWTIIFATTGTCTVQCAGADTFPAPTSATETNLVMGTRGDSFTFRCTSATTWAMV